MKKFFSLFIFIIYFFSTNTCFALNELYILQNTNENAILPKVKSVIINNNYKIKRENPIYAVSEKNCTDYSVIVLMQSGQNLLYYYEANDNNNKLNKKILKNFRKYDIEYEESFNKMQKDSLGKMAANAITGTVKEYTFEIPKTEIQSVTAIKEEKDETKYQGFVGRIEKGTKLNIYLQTAINTATAEKGDNVVAVLKENWLYNNHVVAQEGSVIYGYVAKARQASAGTRNGSVAFIFDRIITPQGKQIDISTEPVVFNVTDEGKFKRIASSTLTSAVVGGIVGLGLAAIFGHGGSSLAEGAIAGASIGGGGALISSVAERGIDAEIPSYTELQIELDKPTDVVLTY